MPSLAGQFILIYGPPGVGKTTFANEMGDTLFLAPEDGQRFLEVYYVGINSWQDFIDSIKQLKAKPKRAKRFKTIAVDTIDNLYAHCAYYVGKKLGFEHPSDEDWGKGYEAIREELRRGLNALASLHKGIVLISHSQDREVKTRTITLTKTMPTLARTAAKIIFPMCSVIIYAAFKNFKDKETGEVVQKHVAYMKPTEHYEAKDRTGRLPEVLPLRARKFLSAYKESK